MTENKYTEELKYLEIFDETMENKIKHIESLYWLAHIIFNYHQKWIDITETKNTI